MRIGEEIKESTSDCFLLRLLHRSQICQMCMMIALSCASYVKECELFGYNPIWHQMHSTETSHPVQFSQAWFCPFMVANKYVEENLLDTEEI